jgi:hypothetical protein
MSGTRENPEEWPRFPEMPPPRGISTALGAKVVSAINAFIISRRFSDEFGDSALPGWTDARAYSPLS